MKVKFLPDNIELEIQPNQSVLDLAHKNGVYIKSVCNGVPNCAECRVRVVEGEHNVLPPLSKELALIGTAHFIDQRRLSCQLRCFGDITVDLTEQKEKQKMEGTKKRLKAGVRAEEDVSFAKTGNLIDQENDILSQVGNEADKRSETDDKTEDFGHLASIDQQVYSDPINPNQKKKKSKKHKPNHQKNKNRPKKAQSSQGSGENNKKSNNKNRNRNRNRNKKNFNKNRNSSSNPKRDS